MAASPPASAQTVVLTPSERAISLVIMTWMTLLAYQSRDHELGVVGEWQKSEIPAPPALAVPALTGGPTPLAGGLAKVLAVPPLRGGSSVVRGDGTERRGSGTLLQRPGTAGNIRASESQR